MVNTGGRAGTLAGHADRYVTGRLQRAETRPATGRQERIVLRGFARTYGQRPVEQLARTHVEHWLAQLNVSLATRRTYFAIVRRFVRWLVERGHVRRDPTLGMRSPRPPRRAPRALTGEDITAAWLHLPDQRARLVVTLMHDLGLRVGEVVRLELGDIDRAHRTVRVVGKGGHERTLPLTARTAHAIDSYLAYDPPRSTVGPLVRSQHDHRSPITAVHLSSLVSRWLTHAGVKARPWDGRTAHAYRHTAASDLVDVEPDLRVVQQFLGHRDLSTTQVYLRGVDQARLRAALDRRAQQPA